MIVIEYFPPLFQVRHIFVLWFDEVNGNIWKSRFHQEKVFFSLAEIETKFIVESVCQKKIQIKSSITFSDNKASKKYSCMYPKP